MAGADPTIVAVVDDDEAVRDSIRLLLETAGHRVDVFASAAEFLNAEVPPFACLILDHEMPRMTGLDLAARLRADGVAIPIMLMTTMLTSAIGERAAGFRVEKVLEKPSIADDVLAFVKATRSI